MVGDRFRLLEVESMRSTVAGTVSSSAVWRALARRDLNKIKHSGGNKKKKNTKWSERMVKTREKALEAMMK